MKQYQCPKCDHLMDEVTNFCTGCGSEFEPLSDATFEPNEKKALEKAVSGLNKKGKALHTPQGDYHHMDVYPSFYKDMSQHIRGLLTPEQAEAKGFKFFRNQQAQAVLFFKTTKEVAERIIEEEESYASVRVNNAIKSISPTNEWLS